MFVAAGFGCLSNRSIRGIRFAVASVREITL
jgi:hypothetical protein